MEAEKKNEKITSLLIKDKKRFEEVLDSLIQKKNELTEAGNIEQVNKVYSAILQETRSLSSFLHNFYEKARGDPNSNKFHVLIPNDEAIYLDKSSSLSDYYVSYDIDDQTLEELKSDNYQRQLYKITKCFVSYEIDKSVSDAYKKLKSRDYSYIICELFHENKSVIVESSGHIENYNEFLSKFLSNDCRFGIFNFNYPFENEMYSKILLIVWLPNTAPSEIRMLYDYSRDNLIKLMSDISLEIQAIDRSELDYDIIFNKIKFA
eukprot:TRINITY_DN5592_c0_g1_i1.p1 TRINITY_DN5592_c0_g1~~TRINITY_DN5592_c0_g1_i1.p1  ORF type:complete len:263 (+),score=95.21 TRINITY_DN5592_c0_g1_i1:53-841(+)